jgi:cellulose synthase/poly-beta-1,6-N-acetylglucosamine synthase-like glycosyltransferase
VTTILALILAVPTLLTLCFATEVLFGIRPVRRRPDSSSAPRNAVIVVPAHDEEAVVGATLAALTEAAAHQARILLVADNCADRTAEIGRTFAVTVIERRDPEKRGKGFALDFAREALRNRPPDVVVVIDADCSIDTASLRELIGQCAASGRPCQARYVQVPANTSAPNVQLSAFAFFVRNVIRQRGLERLGGRAHLVGTGMAFPWILFDKAALASDNIVEDLELGLEFAEKGTPPMLVDGALVRSDVATSRNTLVQRRRWEGGYLDSARRWGPRVLGGGVRRADLPALWSAISLFVPPFALLLLIDFCLLLAVGAVTAATRAGEFPIIMLGGSIAFAALGLVLAWTVGGSQFVRLKALVQAPLYIMWKIPLYLGLARHGAPKQWVRTERD